MKYQIHSNKYGGGDDEIIASEPPCAVCRQALLSLIIIRKTANHSLQILLVKVNLSRWKYTLYKHRITLDFSTDVIRFSLHSFSCRLKSSLQYIAYVSVSGSEPAARYWNILLLWLVWLLFIIRPTFTSTLSVLDSKE